MRENPIRARWAAGQPAVGSWLPILSPRLVEMCGHLGFDFVIIDCEHAPTTTETLEEMVRAAQVTGIAAMVRVPENIPHWILRALDAGADGIHVPTVNTHAEAEAVVRSAKYPPEGARGLAGVRAANYGLTGPLPEYVTQANEHTVVVSQVESVEAVENLDSLLAVEGIDVFYVGPVDLSASMGLRGQASHPDAKALIDQTIGRIVASGRRAGMITSDPSTAAALVKAGVSYICTHVVHFMAAGSRSFLSAIR